MMKTTIVVAVLMALIAGSCFAATQLASVTTYPGWNLVAAPLVPIDPNVEQVMTGYDMWFTAGLTRWDGPTQRMYGYDAFDPNPPGVFGNILLGDGYWLNNPDGGTISYAGVPDGVPDSSDAKTDMWISLPGNQSDGVDAGGWHLVGNPYHGDVAVDSGALTGDLVKFTDGTETLDWDAAAQAGWVDTTVTYWDGANQRMFDMGYFFNTDDHFRKGHGYWVNTYKDNLAMILSAAHETPVP